MLVTIITLFPKMFENVFDSSILARAQKEKKITIRIINLRDFGIGRHKVVDDKPYGGGTGMVLRVDVLNTAIESARIQRAKKEAVILLDPKGKVLNQEKAKKFSKLSHVILICGRYEGFDERIRDIVDYEISIGDYILSGGETAAMVLVDSITRLIPGVLKKNEAITFESFAKIKGKYLLEYPHYTRPRLWRGKKVPKVLLSGNFQKIEEYRRQEAKKLTATRRPDIAY